MPVRCFTMPRTPPHIITVTSLDFEAPLDIVMYPDPRLRAVNAKIGVFGEPVKRLAKEMFRVMYEYVHSGVGCTRWGGSYAHIYVYNNECMHMYTSITVKHKNHRDDGVGLAAPQVGVNVRMMVFNPTVWHIYMCTHAHTCIYSSLTQAHVAALHAHTPALHRTRTHQRYIARAHTSTTHPSHKHHNPPHRVSQGRARK